MCLGMWLGDETMVDLLLANPSPNLCPCPNPNPSPSPSPNPNPTPNPNPNQVDLLLGAAPPALPAPREKTFMATMYA